MRRFLDGTQPTLNFRSGREVVELLMTAYMSAEEEQTLAWKSDGLRDFVPAVQTGRWSP